MYWTGWIVIVLVVVNAGWMLFDGSRAFIVGDYLTPSSGEYAGQLGPWAALVEAVGLDPRSTFVKSVFVLYGVTGLLTAGGFALRLPWTWHGLLILAALGLWYLPFGTAANVIILILLLLSPLRTASTP